MEFNGAVVVSNEKIKKALENYEYLNKKYLNLDKEVREKLLEEFEDLSWWVKFCNENNIVDCVLENKYGQRLHRIFCNDYWEIFFKSGLIYEEDYYSLKGCDYWSSWGNKRAVVEIRKLVLAGEPVYLNPKQAGFVNTFWEE